MAYKLRSRLKTFKQISKVFLWILVGIPCLVMLVSVMLYIPAVQMFAVGKVETAVENATGMKLHVGRFRLKVPLRVEADDAVLVTPAGDTLASAGRLRVVVALWPLLAGRVNSPLIEIENASSTCRDMASAMLLDARVANIELHGAGLNLKKRRVKLRSATISGADVRIEMGEKAPAADTARIDTVAFTLWGVFVGRLDLECSSVAYISSGYVPEPGRFDPAHIRADSIRLSIENTWYRGYDISGGLRRLELSERSGLRIARGNGDFSMTPECLSLKNFELATPDSDIKADARVGAGIMRMEPAALLTANIEAIVNPADIYFFTPADATIRRIVRDEKLTVDGEFSGTLGEITIDRLTASMPGHIGLDASGEVRSVVYPRNLSGNLSLDGTLRDMEFARGFIADTVMRRRIGFPRQMTLSARGSFTPSTYDLPQFTLTADGGRLNATGRFDRRSATYRADADLHDFPLDAFLPNDSLGLATLSLNAAGRGFDPATMDAGGRLTIERLEYKRYDFGRLTLDANAVDGKINGKLESRSHALVMNMDIDGTVSPGDYRAHLTGDIGKADFYGMHLSPDALAVTSTLDITASAFTGTTRIFALDAVLDSTILHYGTRTQRLGRTTMTASSDASQTSAKVSSRDMTLDLSSPLQFDSLISRLGTVSAEIKEQIAARSFHANGLRRTLPVMRLTARAGRGSILRDMALASGVDFRGLSVDVSTVAGAPLRAGIEVDNLHTGTLTLDTLGLAIRQRGDSLGYALRLANRPGNAEHLASIHLYGDVSANRATVNVEQKGRADSVGFRFGLQAELLDSMVRATFVPGNPVFGYQRWSANAGNYFEYRFDNSLYADLQLRGPDDSHAILSSTRMDYIDKGAVRLEMRGIDISHTLDLFPTAPPIGGMLSSDLRFGLHSGMIVTSGSLGVEDFMYDRRRVADVAATLDFRSTPGAPVSLGAKLALDKKTALTASGTYSTEGAGAMDFTVDIPGIPLAAVGAFLPAGSATLSGMLDGRLTLKGPPSAPLISGDAGFTGGKATVDMTGTTYGISPGRITVADGILNLGGSGFVAPNGSKLGIDGTVDIRDFSKMRADLALKAVDFEAIKSTHIGGSQIFGNASLDADITARGLVSALTVRGDINLSESTDITYILRDQIKKVSDERQDIVSFMVFADSLFMETYAPVENLRPQSGVDALVGVTIGDGLNARLYLDEMGENRVDLLGSGHLSWSMNSRGDMRLAGRYTLSGGTVYYKPPVISQKIFAVRDGSYVEWVGEPADPSFNIKATQNMKIDVDMGAGAENTGFDITITIAGSLQSMQVTFDVASPDNATIQSQLMSMAPEQRMQQALSLMLYGQYSAPGTTTQKSSGIDPRGQLDSFIAKEVNQWARNNLKGVDFSMGIDTKDDGSGSGHTDYSYSVSKSFFGDRVKVSIGGAISNDASAQSVRDNLVDDISLEYRLTKSDNMFLKVYHYNTQETIFEGEVTETGVGFLMRKRINKIGDLFRRNKSEKRKTKSEK